MQNAIHFKPNLPGSFYPVLKARVKTYLSTAEAPDRVSVLKCVVFGGAYFIAYALLFAIATPLILLFTYALLGILTTVIVLNILHEAAHDALFTRKALNKYILLWMDFMGTDGQVWKRRHAHHHAYSNIPGHDIDISRSPLVRVDPHAPFRPLHRFQKYYAVFFYFFYTLYWFFWRDIQDVLLNYKLLRLSTADRIRIVFQKIIALFLFIVLPALFSTVSTGYFIAGFFFMHFNMSLLALVTITSSHVNDETEFLLPDDQGNMEYTWAEHQLRVTHDFGADNKLFTLVMGGFNYHVAHHLFPAVSSRHFPALTRIIRDTAKEFNVPYSSDPLLRGFASHFRLIFNNSNAPLEIDL